MWIAYAGIFGGIILMSSLIIGGFTERKEDEYFGKYNSLIFKGIAILCVMTCHLMGDFGNGVTFFTPLGGIGVAIFLMLSGYGLNESWIYGKGGYYWRKRILAVVVPYASVQTIFFWLENNFTIDNYFADIFLLSPNHPYGWYLNYLFLWYIIFYIVMKLHIKKEKKLALLAIISVTLFFVCGEIRAEQSLSFFTGILLSEFKSDKIKKYANWKLGILFVVFGCAFLALKQTDLVRMGSPLIFKFIQMLIKLPCGLGLCLVGMSVASKINLRFLALVGTISYELYLIHGYVLSQVSISLRGEIIFLGLSTSMAVLLWLLMDRTRGIQKKFLKIQ